VGEELFPIKPGQRLEGIPHKAWNAFVEAARYVNGQKRSLRRDALRDVPQTGIVRLKNLSGSDRERFDVLGIDDVFPQPSANPSGFKSGPVLHGVTPAETDHRGKFAILLEPAKPDAIVSAVVAGVTVARVSFTDPSAGFAEVADYDAGALKAGSDGSAAILWKEGGTGIRWCVIRLGNPAAALVYGAGGGAGDVAPGMKCPCTSPILARTITLAGSGLLIPEKGVYSFGFSGTLSAPKAPRNAILRMQLFINDDATAWIGYRENWVRRVSYTQCKSPHSGECVCHGSPIIVDAAVRVPAEGSESPGDPEYGYEYYDCEQETWHTAENVAVSGLVELTAPNTLLNVRNTSSYSFTVGAFLLSAKREGRIP